ncbi:unnamed protein product [Trichobilharzia regenti]|nr:unnamed protein product [Trichobilharzia regenti]
MSSVKARPNYKSFLHTTDLNIHTDRIDTGQNDWQSKNLIVEPWEPLTKPMENERDKMAMARDEWSQEKMMLNDLRLQHQSHKLYFLNSAGARCNDGSPAGYVAACAIDAKKKHFMLRSGAFQQNTTLTLKDIMCPNRIIYSRHHLKYLQLADLQVPHGGCQQSLKSTSMHRMTVTVIVSTYCRSLSNKDIYLNALSCSNIYRNSGVVTLRETCFHNSRDYISICLNDFNMYGKDRSSSRKNRGGGFATFINSQ